MNGQTLSKCFKVCKTVLLHFRKTLNNERRARQLQNDPFLDVTALSLPRTENAYNTNQLVSPPDLKSISSCYQNRFHILDSTFCWLSCVLSFLRRTTSARSESFATRARTFSCSASAWFSLEACTTSSRNGCQRCATTVPTRPFC